MAALCHAPAAAAAVGGGGQGPLEVYRIGPDKGW
eukprot:COSAG01_NODE_13106_length_1634_cov_7.207818_2_plen_33_part_01